MALDFPNSPAIGDKYPTTPIGGVPTYVWDGQKWTTVGGAVSGKTPIYTDGSTAMTAQLTLTGDPINPTDAADKHYVDTATPPPFPSTTTMVFYQAAAPVGWTKLTAQNDRALRVVSGSGGVIGGSNGFSTVMAQSVVGNTTPSVATTAAGITSSATINIVVYPAGNSNYNFPVVSGQAWGGAIITAGSPGNAFAYVGGGTITYTSQHSANNGINVTANNTSGSAHNHPITMDMAYCDVILASKN